MRIKSLLVFTALSGITASPALSDPLGQAIDEILARTPEFSTIRIDLDGDGTEEAVMHGSDYCTAPCPFLIIDTIDGDTMGVAARGSAETVEIRETSPSGHVLDADGVIYAWDGYEMFPHADLLSEIPDRDATGADRRLVARATGQDYYAPDMQVFDTDLVGDDDKETIIIVNAAFVNGMAPFHVFDASGDRIYHGYSMDRPRIYPVIEEEQKRARFVWVTPKGLRLETIN